MVNPFLISLFFLAPPYLDHGCNDDHHNCKGCQFEGLEHGLVLEDEEAHPAQLVCSVGRVAHVVHPLHLQLLDETASQVAQLVKAVLAMVGANPTVTCRGRQSIEISQLLTHMYWLLPVFLLTGSHYCETMFLCMLPYIGRCS